MKYYSTQSGFSLVETLVAISILLVVIVGPMSISSSAAKSTSFASEQVIAFFLAQEGAEMAQKARDDLLLRSFIDPSDPSYEPTPWADFVDTSGGAYDECFTATGCGLELNTDADGTLKTPILCTGSSCELYFNENADRSRYTHVSAGATSTPFTRIIFMTENDNREVEVISRVYWRTGSQRSSQEVEVVTYLFNVYGS